MAFLFPSYWRGPPTTTQPVGEVQPQTPHEGTHDARIAQQASVGATASSRIDSTAALPLPSLLHHVQFNEDGSCVVVVPADKKTFNIYKIYESESTIKLGFTFQRKQNLNGKQIGFATMMGRSNVAAFVGGGENPVAPPNKVILVNLKNCVSMAELSATENEPVLSVQLRKKFIAVATAKYTQLFDFDSTVSLQKWTTQNNPTGALAVSGDENDTVIACPGRDVGHVHVVYFNMLDEPIDLHAHNREVSALAISRDGKRLATTSTKGTVVRVFELNREGAHPVPRVLRRGRGDALISSLCFSPDGRFICASSNHETIHVWDLNTPFPGYQMGSICYKGEKSFGQYTSPYSRTRCGFSPCGTTIYAISTTGHILFLKLDIATGAIEKINEGGIKELTNPDAPPQVGLPEEGKTGSE